MLLGVLSLAKMEESVLKASANADLAFKEKHVKSKPVSTFTHLIFVASTGGNPLMWWFIAFACIIGVTILVFVFGKQLSR